MPLPFSYKEPVLKNLTNIDHSHIIPILSNFLSSAMSALEALLVSDEQPILRLLAAGSRVAIDHRKVRKSAVPTSGGAPVKFSCRSAILLLLRVFQ
jgi:hypothetical protein